MESLTGGHGLTCKSCGYDLRGQSMARCPECGLPFDPMEAGEPAFPRQIPLIPGLIATYALALAFPALLVAHHAKWATFETKLNLWMCSLSGPAALFSQPGHDWHAAWLGVALWVAWMLLFIFYVPARRLRLRHHLAFLGIMIGGAVPITFGGV